MMDASDPWLWHFTHIANLPRIVDSGLLCDSQRPLDVTQCGQASIKERRRSRRVPIPPGGVVADYVPFYFAPRSPMLFSILGGQVKEYADDQTHLIYLVSRLSRVTGLDLVWVATDRNAVLATAKFKGEQQALSSLIDWQVMKAKYWANTADDGSRRERRMAEFLVQNAVPWSAFTHVGTCCDQRQEDVRRILPTSGEHRPKLLVRPSWYFNVPSECACQGGWEQGGGESRDH